MMVEYKLQHKVLALIRVPQTRIDCLHNCTGTGSWNGLCHVPIAVQSGVLNKCYCACDLELFQGNVCLSVKGWESSACLSLQEASKENTLWRVISKNRSSTQQAAALKGALAGKGPLSCKMRCNSAKYCSCKKKKNLLL